MSEDSDYTSDMNYPLQHQHNSSAHQFRSEHPYQARREDSHDSQQTMGSQEYYSSREYYADSFDRSGSFENDPRDHDYPDHGYEPRGEREYYSPYPENSYHTGRSDTDSEPLYYNSRPISRPQSFLHDRWVQCFALTFHSGPDPPALSPLPSTLCITFPSLNIWHPLFNTSRKTSESFSLLLGLGTSQVIF